MFNSLEEIKGKTFYLRHVSVDPWVGRRKFDHTFDDLGPALDSFGSPVTGLTEDSVKTLKSGSKEQVKGTRRLMEESLGLKEGFLKKGMPDVPNEYWVNYAPKLSGIDMKLSGDVPEHQLTILYLAAQPQIAVGVKNKQSLTEYILYTKEDAAQDANNKKKVRRDAYIAFDKLTLGEQGEILEMYGTRARSLDAGVIEDKLTDELEANPKRFLAIVNDPKRNQKSYIRKCLDAGALNMEDGNIMYGSTMLGYDINSAADMLFSDEHAKSREAIKIILEKNS